MNSLIRFTKGAALICLGVTVALLGLGAASALAVVHVPEVMCVVVALAFFGAGIMIVERGMQKW